METRRAGTSADIAALLVFMRVIGAYGLVTMQVTWLSRWRERLADQYALESTQHAHAFTSVVPIGFDK